MERESLTIFRLLLAWLILTMLQKVKEEKEIEKINRLLVLFAINSYNRIIGPSDLYKILKMINMKNFHPVIVFSFSKRECEANAVQLSKLDFNTDDEKALVKSIYENAIQSLGEEDRGLPMILNLLPLLTRGIGIHHSGLLPILKEVVEILFQEGLLKVLFATETFSIGLNMPAKTVVFTSVSKFDGKETRFLTGGEYIQMSGRAGRRGLDDRGIVILMINQKLEPDVAKGMLKGESDPLNSAFHLTYTMILNLMRVDGFITHEYMLENSFHQFQHSARIPKIDADISILQARLEAPEMMIKHEDLVGEMYQISTQLEAYEQDVAAVISSPTYCLPFLQPGRLVSIISTTVSKKRQVFGWGIVINFQKVASKKEGGGVNFIADVLLHCSNSSDHQKGEFIPYSKEENDGGVMLLVPCTLDFITKLSAVRVHTPPEIKSSESRKQLLKTLQQVLTRFPNDTIPLLDPVKEMRITDSSFVKLVSKIDVLKSRRETCGFATLVLPKEEKDAYYATYLLKVEIMVKIQELKDEKEKAESVLQMDELKGRLRILRRLGYTSEMDIIEMKGRVACEISAGDELVLTEMILNGVFNDLNVAQTAALLSCFTAGEVAKDVELPAELAKPFKLLQETARNVAKVTNECKVPLDEARYLDNFQSTLMPAVYAWTLGAKFVQITKMTDVFEGSIIRSIKRLDELLRQMVDAAKTIGNLELEQKFDACSVAIKRDIVFSNSLYL